MQVLRAHIEGAKIPAAVPAHFSDSSINHAALISIKSDCVPDQPDLEAFPVAVAFNERRAEGIVVSVG